MKLSRDKDQLTIKLQGFEIIWALKRRVVIPRHEIKDIAWRPGPLKPESFKGIRRPGTVIPGVLMIGTFTHKAKWQFWCIYLTTPGEIVITTKKNKEKYSKIRLSATEEIANFVMDWWKKTL